MTPATTKPFGNNVTQCPHCGCHARTLKSDQITPTYREIRYACTNKACAHIFVADLSVVRTLVPSALPNPQVNIPLSNAAGAASTADNQNQHELFEAPVGAA
ncbi:MAG: ogr/Delta-like zinc finger family protein [Rhodospirillaceae bacterium]|nr:ogr/Delta-like zinc finger family protein [Rhodospirillales bacterium]